MERLCVVLLILAVAAPTTFAARWNVNQANAKQAARWMANIQHSCRIRPHNVIGDNVFEFMVHQHLCQIRSLQGATLTGLPHAASKAEVESPSGHVNRVFAHPDSSQSGAHYGESPIGIWRAKVENPTADLGKSIRLLLHGQGLELETFDADTTSASPTDSTTTTTATPQTTATTESTTTTESTATTTSTTPTTATTESTTTTTATTQTTATTETTATTKTTPTSETSATTMSTTPSGASAGSFSFLAVVLASALSFFIF